LLSLSGGRYSEIISLHMANHEQQPNPKQAALDELARIEEDTLHSAKGHFEAGEEWRKWNLRLGLPAAVLAALAGVSALSTFDRHNVVAGVLALIVAAMTGAATFLNPSDRATQHHSFGTAYSAVRNDTRIAANIESASLSEAELTERVKELSKTRNELNANAPQIPRYAYDRAKKGIVAGEARHAVD
jgi:hypothetical protein